MSEPIKDYYHSTFNHLDGDVQKALVDLSTALVQWERATGRQSVLILREEPDFVCRLNSGKPGVPDDVLDSQLLGIILNQQEKS